MFTTRDHVNGYVRWLPGHTASIGPLDKYRMSVYTGNRVRITRMLDVTSRWKVFFIPFYFRGSPFFFRGVDP
jgi:hypothetical protein